MNSLLRLAETKANKPAMNLMHYVAKVGLGRPGLCSQSDQGSHLKTGYDGSWHIAWNTWNSLLSIDMTHCYTNPVLTLSTQVGWGFHCYY